jgi:hypothetical protein
MLVKCSIWEPFAFKAPNAHDCFGICRHVTAPHTSPMILFLVIIDLIYHGLNKFMVVRLLKGLLLGKRLVQRFARLSKSGKKIYRAVIKSIDSMKAVDHGSKQRWLLFGMMHQCCCCHAICTEQAEEHQSCHFIKALLD